MLITIVATAVATVNLASQQTNNTERERLGRTWIRGLEYGANGQDRTAGLLFTKQLLYH